MRVILLLESILFIAATTLLIIMNRKNQKQENSNDEIENKDMTNHTPIPTYFGKNRRKSFRVEVSDIPCTIVFLDFEDKRFIKLSYKTIVGQIENVGLGGLKFYTSVNLPVNKSIFVKINFKLQEHEFFLNGKICRKEEYLNKNRFGYGIQFDKITTKEETDLLFVLNQYLIEKEKKIISN